MKHMLNILHNVGKSWGKLPKEKPVIQLEKANGQHSLVTIHRDIFCLHSQVYCDNLPIKQEIALKGITIEELVTVLTSMGYNASLYEELPSNLREREATTLTSVKDQSIELSVALTTFTAKLWEKLYPLARLLEEADYNINIALKQMFITSTRGLWLDYWASFFNVRRIEGESDESLLKRVFMTIVNMKTNNIALEELIRHAIESEVKVSDTGNHAFEVVTHPEFISRVDLVVGIINSLKGAGIEYVLNYTAEYEELYASYVQDKTGKSAREQDSLHVLPGEYLEAQYGWRSADYIEGEVGFQANGTELNSGAIYDLVYLMNDEIADKWVEINYSETFPKPINVILPFTSDVSMEELYNKAIEDLRIENENKTSEDSFLYRVGFTCNESTLNEDENLCGEHHIIESGSMTLTENGTQLRYEVLI